MSRATLALDRRALEQFIVLDPNPPSHLRTTRHFKAQCHQGPFQERRSHYLTLLCLAFFFWPSCDCLSTDSTSTPCSRLAGHNASASKSTRDALYGIDRNNVIVTTHVDTDGQVTNLRLSYGWWKIVEGCELDVGLFFCYNACSSVWWKLVQASNSPKQLALLASIFSWMNHIQLS
jgi:hypothetical protein